MGWIRIGGWAVAAMLLVPGVATAQVNAWERYQGLGVPGQAGVEVALALFLGVIVLGLFPDWGRRAVATARRSPILSGAVGLPVTLALGVLYFIGVILASTIIGIVVGIPLVVVSLSLLLAWRAVGYIALGAFVASRFGRDNQWVGLLVGAVIVGVTGFAPVPFEVIGATAIATALLVLAATVEVIVIFVGVGAGARASFGGGGVDPDRERNVPPAHEV